jgi:hypothetical protein
LFQFCCRRQLNVRHPDIAVRQVLYNLARLQVGWGWNVGAHAAQG